MSGKTFNTRLVSKHDVEVNWLKAVNFIPMQGEIVIYDIDENYTYERFKIGDGKTLVGDLPFAAVKSWDELEDRPFYSEGGGKNLFERDTEAFADAWVDHSRVFFIKNPGWINLNKQYDITIRGDVYRNFGFAKHHSYYDFAVCGSYRPDYHGDNPVYTFGIVCAWPYEGTDFVDQNWDTDGNWIGTLETAQDFNYPQLQFDPEKYPDLRPEEVVITEVEVVHTIDPKYIKDMYYCNTKEAVFYENSELELSEQFTENFGISMLTEGDFYTVIWNGQTYACVARNDGYDDIYIGNQMLSDGWDFSETIESDEPFFIATHADENWSEIGVESTGTYSIVVNGIISEIKQIDEKYLPDNLAKLENVDNWERLGDDINNKFPAGSYDFSTAITSGDYSGMYQASSLYMPYNGLSSSIVTATKFRVLWDDEIYEFNRDTVLNGTEYDWTFGGNLDSEYPFYIVIYDQSYGSIYLYAANEGTHSVDIEMVSGSQLAVSEQYIPTTIARASDVVCGDWLETDESNYAYIKHKPRIEPAPDGSVLICGASEADLSSVAMGTNSKADYYSIAQGHGVEATGHYSHAEGRQTKAISDNSHAEGFRTIAKYEYSHVEGKYNTDDPFIEKIETVGTSDSSSWSYQTSTQYTFDSTTGLFTLVNPVRSKLPTEPNVYYSLNAQDSSLDVFTSVTSSSEKYGTVKVEGTHKKLTSYLENSYAHIVGNGTSSSARSNAHTLDWDGNAWFAGDVYVGSNSAVNKDDGSKKLATEAYVDNLSAADIDGGTW